VNGPGPSHRLSSPAERIGLAMSLTIATVGLVILALVPRDSRLGPPGDLRLAVVGLAIVALALVGAAGAVRDRPVMLASAGIVCIPGAYLSVATLWLVVPGLVLIGCAISMDRRIGTSWRDLALGAIVAAGLVVGTTLGIGGEERCWIASGSLDNPVYTIVPATDRGVQEVGGPDGSFASGCDGGVVSTADAAPAAALLAGASLLAWASRPIDRRPARG
jgi:hypothetical protein